LLPFRFLDTRTLGGLVLFGAFDGCAVPLEPCRIDTVLPFAVDGVGDVLVAVLDGDVFWGAALEVLHVKRGPVAEEKLDKVVLIVACS
jgi:hypothetical protein